MIFRFCIVVAMTLMGGALAGCNASHQTALSPVRVTTGIEQDDPRSVAGLRAMNAEMRTDSDGFVTFVDVSERDEVTDETFQYFAGLPRLREIHAIYTPVTGAALKHLAETQHLETLDLYGCPIDDDSLASVGKLTNLRSLNLIGSRITDDSIDLLSSLQNLQYLGIGSTGISESGRKRLAEALPADCEID